jgi:hypothetical protein
MFALMLAVSPAWIGAAPPGPTRIDPIAIYTNFLLSDLKNLSRLNETIARSKENARRFPGRAASSEQVLVKAHEARDKTFRSLYDSACRLLKEIRFRIWYEFRIFVLRRSPSE